MKATEIRNQARGLEAKLLKGPTGPVQIAQDRNRGDAETRRWQEAIDTFPLPSHVSRGRLEYYKAGAWAMFKHLSKHLRKGRQ